MQRDDILGDRLISCILLLLFGAGIHGLVRRRREARRISSKLLPVEIQKEKKKNKPELGNIVELYKLVDVTRLH